MFPLKNVACERLILQFCEILLFAILKMCDHWKNKENVWYQQNTRNDHVFYISLTLCELARSYGIDLNHTNCSKTQIRHVIRSFFVRKWQESVADINKNPILRTYVRFKYNFGIESYLVSVKNPRYRAAISKLRTSSHALEVERGRHTKPKTPLEERLCPNCHVLEDEQHFVM